MSTIHDVPEQLVALNADVVGYSKLLADDLETTMEDYRRLVEEAVEADGGTLINLVGDNFMAVFDDAVSGVRTAIGISSEIEGRNANVPTSRWVRFRMGMDQGEIAVSGSQYFVTR